MYCCPLSPVQLVEDVEKHKLDCPSKPKPSHCAIHSCYDGLAVIQVSDILDRDNFTILLWNPSTIESVVLLRIECPPGSLSRFGLGYDSINGEYKILHICQDLRSKTITIEILALKGTDIFKIWALKEYGVKGSWMLLLTVEEPDLSLNAKPTYLFADGEVLFRCMSYQHIVHTFRTLNGPFRSWPICDTMQGGSAFTESLISPKSLTY
ncbi:hypothetical protein T459_29107 [Capsicum annuum]|uniref:F-box associated beta-propeller type 3 domain-containing protein n=1 Tax=Capsicum annuum TaxID=4072 RepID=A0A2G2Y4L1_CAPAN|nr:hypothetical protein T459_29107 [Capsicum annuum]